MKFVIIRNARTEDAGRILEIYAYYVEHGYFLWTAMFLRLRILKIACCVQWKISYLVAEEDVVQAMLARAFVGRGL